MVAMCWSFSSFIIPSRRLRQACQNQSSKRVTQNANRWDLNFWELPQKLQQPLVIHRVEKAAYVRFDEVIHTLLLDGASQCIQALVRTPLGALAIATVFE